MTITNYSIIFSVLQWKGVKGTLIYSVCCGSYWISICLVL